MLDNGNHKKFINTLRQPKIFQAPKDPRKNIWPSIIKYAILIFLTLSIIIYLIFFCGFFKIKNIEFVGSPSDEVKTELNQLIGHNIFSFSAKSLEQKLVVENKNLAGVKIYRGIPDTIRIVMDDRVPKIIWQSGSHQYLVDNNATIYKEITVNSMPSLPVVIDLNNLVVQNLSTVATPDFVAFIQSANDALTKANIKITNFEVSETTFQVTVVTDKNIRIILNTMRPLSEQIDAFNQVFTAHQNEIKEYIDLRVEGRVYFK